MLRSKRDKRKEFLSMDLIDRMVRVEQRVSASFNEFVPYNKTEYYKSLTEGERKSFERYLKTKGRKKFFALFLLIIPLVALFMINSEFTGRVINENIGEYNPSIVSILILSLLFVMIFVYITNAIFRKIKDKRFESHFKVIEGRHFSKSLNKYIRGKDI